MTKHDIVKAFFSEKVEELAGEQLHFNFSPDSDGAISFITNYADRVLREFITGDKELEYGFAFILDKPYSTDTDDINLEAMNFAQSFIDWIDELNETHTYPDFGVNVEVIKIDNLQNMPNLALINPDAGLARYQIQARIRYRVNI